MRTIFSNVHRGTSPRVWGKLRQHPPNGRRGRNIPTRVGKTSQGRTSPCRYPEHPHACGENPRRRTIHQDWLRNIPTRVGKTHQRQTKRRLESEHPHACGENVIFSPSLVTVDGTSPRVWGKLGTRPAKADNLPEHPHACGENASCVSALALISGTSPRVWGKLFRDRIDAQLKRNIPTRVGKTWPRAVSKSALTEHPHACGENSSRLAAVEPEPGTSPRVWGKRCGRHDRLQGSRNIPTRVGKTALQDNVPSAKTEHPHACGENSSICLNIFS